MKIKLLTSMSGSDVDFSYGDEIDIDTATANRLIETQQAEPIKVKPKAAKSKPVKK